MSSNSQAIAINANDPSNEMGLSSAQSGAVMEVFGKLFPDDTIKTLARILCLSPDGAKKKLNGDRDLSLAQFCRLLNTPDGFRYLTAAMGDAQAEWWRICCPLMEVAEIQKIQMAARRKLRRVVKGAMDANADLAAAISRAEAFQDEEFHRPDVDALRSMARVPDRALAPAAKGRK